MEEEKQEQPAEEVKKPAEASEKAGEEEAKAPAKAKVKAVKKKSKIKRQISHGRAYIKSTYNNTIITITDLNGNTLAWSSAGICGFKGPKKSTPYAAGIITKDVVTKAKEYGLKEVNVFIRGVGSGREAAVRAFNINGIQVLTIKDITPIPHGGCRPPKPRRV